MGEAFIVRRGGVREAPIDDYKIYGVSVDLTNSNPETSVTYSDDAVGMEGGSAGWDSLPIFRDIKPCVLKNGAVQYYLKADDFTKKVDSTTADLSGTDGDVMIQIPKIGYLIESSGNSLTVKVTNNPYLGAQGFRYYAHTRLTEGDCDNLYIGAYQAFISGSILRSVNGATPTVSQTLSAFRTAAQANGAGYDQLSFYPLTLIQCLYLVRFKNLNSQAALGMGYVSGNSAAIATGGANAKGMHFGETTGKLQMKCFGIEDLWGNTETRIDGVRTSNFALYTAFTGFNDAGTGYQSRGTLASAKLDSYMSKPQGSSEAGFVVKGVSGSATTYFTDRAAYEETQLSAFGGSYASGSDAGIFSLRFSFGELHSLATFGGRLMYLKEDN